MSLIRHVTVVLSAFLILAVGGSGQTPSGAPTMSLQRAISSGRLSADISGIGSSSGDSIKMKIRKRGPRPVSISIPPGTMLRNSSGGEQDMVVSGVSGQDMGGGMVRPMARITLTDNRPITVYLRAFCAAFEKDNPSDGSDFSLAAPDPTLACITRRANNLSVPAEQAAVWIVTDNITFEHMNEKFPVTRGEWSAAMRVAAACGVTH
jgi:hypothetical protein